MQKFIQKFSQFHSRTKIGVPFTFAGRKKVPAQHHQVQQLKAHKPVRIMRMMCLGFSVAFFPQAKK